MKRVLRLALIGSALLTPVLAGRDAAAQQAPTCAAPKTTCAGHSGYYASAEDVDRLTAVADPVLRDVRGCLDGVGAKQVTSVLLIRWDSDGKPVDVKIDVPGYESLACVQKAQKKLAVLQNPRETAIRCEYGCPQSAAPPPAPAPPPTPAPPPVVTPPPAAKEAPPPPAAKEAPPPAPEQPRYEKTWYGYQTLTVDALSFAAMIGGLAGRTGGVLAGGYVAFLLGTPVVHMVHGNLGPGFGSIGLRLLVPVIGLGVGAISGLFIGGSHGEGLDAVGNGASGAATGAVVGALVGGLGCMLIDAAGLAYAKEKVEATARAPRTLKLGSVTPTFAVQKDHASVGVVGTF
jgi:hypothetical protein